MEKLFVKEKTNVIHKQKHRTPSTPLKNPSNQRPFRKKTFKKNFNFYLAGTKTSRVNIVYYAVGRVIIAGVAGFFSSLLGHTLLEQTRRDQIQMKEKILKLKYEISYLKGKIEEAKYHETIDRWAETKGMVNERLNQTKIEENNTLNQKTEDAYVTSF